MCIYVKGVLLHHVEATLFEKLILVVLSFFAKYALIELGLTTCYMYLTFLWWNYDVA